jgi:hypothetical protein
VTKTLIDIRHEQPMGHSLLELSDHPCLALKDRDVRGLGEKRPKLAARIPIYSARLRRLERGTVSPPPLARLAQDEELDRPAIIYLSFT